MKKSVIISAIFMLTALSAQAATLERCFKLESGKLAQIIMTDRSVTIDFDLADRAENTVMSSNFLENIRRTETSIMADAFLQGTGDGYDLRFTIKKNTVIFQTLWSTGKPTGAAVELPIVKCP